jgi:hypothetical protein
MNRSTLAVLLVVGLAASGVAAPPKTHAFAIVVGEGSSRHEVVTDADIVAFNWAEQTVKVRSEVLPRIPLKGVLDAQFSLLVHGNLVYSGRFVSWASSKSYAEPIILVDPIQAGDTTVTLTIFREHYHERKYQTDKDVRFDERIAGALFALGKLVTGTQPSADDKPALSKAVEGMLKDCMAIKPGMTREELCKKFTGEGGLSTAEGRTYVHLLCPYIKIDVGFKRSDAKQSIVEERLTDVITKVSRPYLAWPTMD